MVRIGIIGIGFMGWTHFAGATKINAQGKPAGSKLKGGAITAICTRSPNKLSGDWTSIQGNFGPRAPKLDLTKISAYDNYQELLADPEIDLIDVCLPNDQHEAVTIAALQAGKHVLVEKPISTEIKSAERMVAAAKKSGKLLMVAQVLPFFPEFQFAAECVSSQKYGKLLAAHFRRVIAPPKWSDDMSNFRKLGGWGIEQKRARMLAGLAQGAVGRALDINDNQNYLALREKVLASLEALRGLSSRKTICG